MSPDWEWLKQGVAAPYMTLEEYLALPEDVAGSVEVIGGMIVHCESPSESHVGIQQNLAAGLQDGAEKHDSEWGSCHRVRMELDVLLEDSPGFTFRRPDVVVYRSTPPGRRGAWSKPLASDVVVVIEVVSEHSAGVDLFEKRARYAAAGIPSYWIVRMAGNDGPAVSIERLRLTSDGIYVSEGVTVRDRSIWAVEAIDPFPITISWEALDRGVV